MKWNDGTTVEDGIYAAAVKDGEIYTLSPIGAPRELEGDEPQKPGALGDWTVSQEGGHVSVYAPSLIFDPYELRMHCSTNSHPVPGDGVTAPLVKGAYTTKGQFGLGETVNVWLYWKNTETGEYTLADGPKSVTIPEPPPSKPAEPVGTVGPGELEAAIKASDGPIELRDQHYGTLKLSGVKKNGLIISANGATFDYVELDNCEGIHLDGFTVDRGDLNQARAVYFRGGRKLSFVNGDVRGAVSGIVVFGTDDIDITGNRVDHVRSDFFKFSGVVGGKIVGNVGGGHLFPNGTDHADFMQFQGAECRDLEIRDNTYIAQNNVRAQGIYAEGKAPLYNCLIQGNIVVTGKVRQISVAEGSGNKIIDNLCVMIRNGQNQTGRIFAPGGTALSDNRVIQTGRLGMTLKEVMAL